jgi:hypothetical protein
MPIPPPLLESGWLAANALHATLPLSGRSAADSTALAAAVAAIVAVAAQRALAAGDLPGLRALIDRALDAAESAPPNAAEETQLPSIADAEPRQERRRLSALMRRQRG